MSCSAFLFYLLFIVLYSKSDIVLLNIVYSEMIDGCRALLSIGTVTTPVVFDQLLRSLRSLTYNLFFAVKAIWFFFIHKIVVLSVSSGPLALLHSYLC